MTILHFIIACKFQAIIKCCHFFFITIWFFVNDTGLSFTVFTIVTIKTCLTLSNGNLTVRTIFTVNADSTVFTI